MIQRLNYQLVRWGLQNNRSFRMTPTLMHNISTMFTIRLKTERYIILISRKVRRMFPYLTLRTKLKSIFYFSFRKVIYYVQTLVSKFEIVKVIIKSISINMMDNLFTSKRSSDMLRHYISMFVDSFFIIVNYFITIAINSTTFIIKIGVRVTMFSPSKVMFLAIPSCHMWFRAIFYRTSFHKNNYNTMYNYVKIKDIYTEGVQYELGSLQ